MYLLSCNSTWNNDFVLVVLKQNFFIWSLNKLEISDFTQITHKASFKMEENNPKVIASRDTFLCSREYFIQDQ